MQIGIAGSASIEGTHQMAGIVMDNTGDDAVMKRVCMIWIGAVLLLALFHVGGSKL